MRTPQASLRREPPGAGAGARHSPPAARPARLQARRPRRVSGARAPGGHVTADGPRGVPARQTPRSPRAPRARPAAGAAALSSPSSPSAGCGGLGVSAFHPPGRGVPRGGRRRGRRPALPGSAGGARRAARTYLRGWRGSRSSRVVLSRAGAAARPGRRPPTRPRPRPRLPGPAELAEAGGGGRGWGRARRPLGALGARLFVGLFVGLFAGPARPPAETRGRMPGGDSRRSMATRQRPDAHGPVDLLNKLRRGWGC